MTASMNDIITITQAQTMSSLQIAELTGKNHKEVMRSIRNMEPAWEKVNGRKFALVEYRDAKGEARPCYNLTKTECLYVATKFNDEARAKLVLRWEELEAEAAKQYQVPTSFREALLLAAAQQERIEEQQKQIAAQSATIGAQQGKIEADAPKVLFAEAVTGSKSTCLIGELAKLITQNGYKIGQNRLFEWMRENGYLGKRGEYYNIPNQQYMEMGLFDVKKTVHDENGVLVTKTTTKVTGKGQQYFINKFLYQ